MSSGDFVEMRSEPNPPLNAMQVSRRMSPPSKTRVSHLYSEKCAALVVLDNFYRKSTDFVVSSPQFSSSCVSLQGVFLNY